MLFLGPADLHSFNSSALEGLLERRELVVAFGEGAMGGLATAGLLFADYAVLRRGATLAIETPEAWAAVVWRLGRSVLRWHLRGSPDDELVDELSDVDSATWLEEWTRRRSVRALDSAAVLIRARGGDSLERAEFARLFAIGEPQTGLRAFLAKQKPQF